MRNAYFSGMTGALLYGLAESELIEMTEDKKCDASSNLGYFPQQNLYLVYDTVAEQGDSRYRACFQNFMKIMY